MKFVVMDTYGYFGNIMPRNHFVKDISEIYKTQKNTNIQQDSHTAKK